MKQSGESAKKYSLAAITCKLNADEALDSLTDSTEAANKMAQALHSQGDAQDNWLKWWIKFLEEWTHKCFIMCLSKCEDSKDYDKVLDLWHSGFENLWEAGCEYVRDVRMYEFRDSMSGVISHESLSRADEDAFWQWINSYDELALKAINSFSEKNSQSFTRLLKELKEYDKASLFGKLKHHRKG